MNEQNWDGQADVVVLGSGVAGLIAAVEASGSGASVIVLEKDSRAGGHSLSSEHDGRWMAVDTSVQKRFGIPPSQRGTPDDFFRLLTAGQEASVNLALARAVADNSAEGIEWALELGHDFVAIDPTAEFPPPRPPPQPWVHRSKDGGPGWVKVLQRTAEERGVRILLNHRSRQLITNGKREVVGVRADSYGTQLHFRARRGVILATGGFARNKDMQSRFSERASIGDPYTISPQATGDGIKMAQEIGADLETMEWASIGIAAPIPPGYVAGGRFGPIIRAGGGIIRGAVHGDGHGVGAPSIFVNLHGRRFVKERVYDRSYITQMCFQQEEHAAFAIFDDEGRKMGGGTIADGFSENLEKELSLGIVVQGGTAQDLAEKLGINPENLAKTIAEYNKCLADGKQESDGIGVASNAKPIRTPPFYGLETNYLLTNTFGGPKIDVNSRVIDVWGEPIRRLYAVGTVAGGYVAKWYQGGIYFPNWACLGRVAARNACAERPL